MSTRTKWNDRATSGGTISYGSPKKESSSKKKRKRKKRQHKLEQSGLLLTINGRTLSDSSLRRSIENPTAANASSSSLSPEATATLLQRWMQEVWNEGRLETVDELFAPNGTNHERDIPVLQGREALKRHIMNVRSAFPDLHVTVEGIAQSGAQAVVRWHAAMTHMGPYYGVEPSNKRVESSGISFFNIRGGSIHEIGVARGDGVMSEASADQMKSAKLKAKAVALATESISQEAIHTNGAKIEVDEEDDNEVIIPLDLTPRRSRKRASSISSPNVTYVTSATPPIKSVDHSSRRSPSTKKRAVLRKKTA